MTLVRKDLDGLRAERGQVARQLFRQRPLIAAGIARIERDQLGKSFLDADLADLGDFGGFRMDACGFASTTALTTPSPGFMIFLEPSARFETRTKFLFPTSCNLGAASDRWNEHARHSREARCGQSQVAPPYHGRVRTHPNGRGGRFDPCVV
jgi:hypothetical protein